MPSLTLAAVLQVIVGFGLLNVWLVRSKATTAFRGGSARSLKEEFATYGLPPWAFYVVGALKVGAAIALIVGLWVPWLVRPAAGLIVVLMLGALAMHLKVQDPPKKAAPALLVLLMSAAIVALA